jgi:hypothetical protein
MISLEHTGGPIMQPHSVTESPPPDELLYVARVEAVAAPRPEPHAIFGRVFEPELTPLPAAEVAPGLDPATVRVRALDQLVAALAG